MCWADRISSASTPYPFKIMARVFIHYENTHDRDIPSDGRGALRCLLLHNGQDSMEINVSRVWETHQSGGCIDEYEVINGELFRNDLETFFGERIIFDKNGEGWVRRG